MAEPIQGVPEGLQEEKLPSTTNVVEGVPEGLTEEALPTTPTTTTEKKKSEATPGFLESTNQKVDTAVTNVLAPNPENLKSFARTQAIEVPKTLGREVVSAAKTAYGMPKAIYGAFAEPATPEEKAQHAQFEQENKEAPGAETSGFKRIGLGVSRMLGLNEGNPLK